MMKKYRTPEQILFSQILIILRNTQYFVITLNLGTTIIMFLFFFQIIANYYLYFYLKDYTLRIYFSGKKLYITF